MPDATLKDRALALAPELTRLRRSIHAYPETGWLEMRTSAIIAHTLKELGYDVLTGREAVRAESRLGLPGEEVLRAHALDALAQEGTPGDCLTQDMQAGLTGVIGILRCGEGPVVALRFDIDALPMQERNDQGHRPFREGFASRTPGMMHACGHDGHVAIGLGTARLLMEERQRLHGTLKLIFQPAEEGARGARAVTDAGHLDDVDFLIGNHIAPDDTLDDGDVTCGTYGSLATTKLDAVFRGVAAHAGGYPENGRNALAAACTAVTGLLALPRHSAGQSRVNCGSLVCEGGRNVIPDLARLQLEVRGETTEINRFMTESARRVLEGAAAMYGCHADLTVVGEAEGQASDPCLIDRIASAVRRDLPFLRLSSVQNARNWGSEDISIMMNRVQSHGGKATYMRTMTALSGAQHTVGFDFDEQVLPRAVMVFCAAVLDLMGGSQA